MDRPRFSLIACTVGRRKKLDRLFNSFLQQQLADFEVVLVDQSAPGYLDGLIHDFVSKLTLRPVRSEKGLSRSRNVGIRYAKGELLGFPDDDCWYPPDVLRRVAEHFHQNPDHDLVLGKTVDQFGNDSLGKFRRSSGSVSKWNLWASGNSNSLFLRRRVALKVGGFDETLGVGAKTPFQSGEETDFVLRTLEAGAVAFYDTELKVHHQQVDSEIGAPQVARARAYSPGFGRVLRKHRYGIPYLFYRVGRSTLRAILALAAFDPDMARYKLAWAAGTLRGYVATVGSRCPSGTWPPPPGTA